MDGKTDYEKVRAFAKRLRKDYSDAEVILFGSRARGDALEESDFDIIAVSRAFEGTNFFRRIENMYDYWREKEPLEVFCYTPEEFEAKRAQIGTVKTALETAVKVGA